MCTTDKAKRSNSQDDWEAYTLLQNKEFYKYNTERGTQLICTTEGWLFDNFFSQLAFSGNR